MISERKLASSHSSFWRAAMPLADAFVRAMNASLERFAMPLPSAGPPTRNALLSELAFRLYENALAGRMSLEAEPVQQAERVQKIADDVRRYISALERGVEYAEISAGEMRESFTLATRLDSCMKSLEPSKAIVVRPKFAGCGIIDDCEGDLLVGETLYEVKNVERRFRIADVRQLLCYCALNSASHEHAIESVGLVNARSGRLYRISLNALCLASSGEPAVALLSEIIGYAGADLPSR